MNRYFCSIESYLNLILGKDMFHCFDHRYTEYNNAMLAVSGGIVVMFVLSIFYFLTKYHMVSIKSVKQCHHILYLSFKQPIFSSLVYCYKIV